ncbi:hypothetical protein [Enterobacter sp. ENT03]|uniref:hypothetical protein n=1 Tax=Enterobacter sp. ENT03 TaxID=2854780 RepID=UPI001C488751|nr:hypothetical protein [Enterobacter sp. ENT03]MBV7405862.1 hypothetical protein [Enterobacter sp. ENT03]
MFTINRSRINVNTDTLQSAIHKKEHNAALSEKSFNKLIKIANTHYKFNNGEAGFIFGKSVCGKNINYEGVSRLVDTLKKVTSLKSESFINNQIGLWQNNAEKLLIKNEAIGSSKALTDSSKALIGSGARGVVYRDGDYVIKEMKFFDPHKAQHEVTLCNEYNKKTGGSELVATMIDGGIKMPFLHGTRPGFSETLAGVKEMYNQGFFIADPKPDNFLKTAKGNVVPVDFGLVFSKNNLEDLSHELKKEIVYDYIKGGYRHVPDDLKPEYVRVINSFDLSLGKDSPMRKTNIKALTRAGFGLAR